MKGSKIHKLQEKRLLGKIQNGDEESFGKIYDWYVNRIFKYVSLKIGSIEKAEEIVQDVFLKFWRFARDKENKVKNISAFLYKIAKSMVADHYRTTAGEGKIISLEETIIVEDETIGEEELADNIDLNLDIEKIKMALEKLPRSYQDVIIMKFMEELTNKEIAEILEKEEGHIRVLAHRALKQLRSLLKSND